MPQAVIGTYPLAAVDCGNRSQSEVLQAGASTEPAVIHRQVVICALEVGLGAAVCIDGMIPQEFADRVVFRPFAPALVSDVYLAWRKNAALSLAASALVNAIRT